MPIAGPEQVPIIHVPGMNIITGHNPGRIMRQGQVVPPPSIRKVQGVP